QCQVSTQNEGCSSLSFRAFPVRWFAVTALAALRRFCSVTQVRDLATGAAAIRPSPCADVDLSIVLEQLVHALFRHETMTPCAFHTALLCRLRSPKGRGGHLTRSFPCATTGKRLSPQNRSITTTPLSPVRSVGGPPRVDRPIRHRSCVSLRLKVLVAGRASAASTCLPARAVQSPAPSPDETARARLSVCGLPTPAPHVHEHRAHRRAPCVLD